MSSSSHIHPQEKCLPASFSWSKNIFSNLEVLKLRLPPRFACYSTCSAASFASTTSCTFGGLFWWLPCWISTAKCFLLSLQKFLKTLQSISGAPHWLAPRSSLFWPPIKADHRTSCSENWNGYKENLDLKFLLLILKKKKIINKEHLAFSHH